MFINKFSVYDWYSPESSSISDDIESIVSKDRDTYNLIAQEFIDRTPMEDNDIVTPQEEDSKKDYTIKVPKPAKNKKADKEESKIEQPKSFNSNAQFVNYMIPLYEKVLRQKGKDPRFAHMLVAMDATESGWGKHIKGDYNFGNLTTNGDNWHVQTGNSKWQDFSSIEDYVSEKIDRLGNSRYKMFDSFKPEDDIATIMQTLADRGYDPGNKNYGKTVSDVHRTMQRYLTAVSTSTDIQDLFEQQGLTHINGKRIKFGSREPRPQNSTIGVKNSRHKRRDPETGYAMARDMSIERGTIQDYVAFRKAILSNPVIVDWMNKKQWGIINELTPEIRSTTNGTGNHFHFAGDPKALRTWGAWQTNPDMDITISV